MAPQLQLLGCSKKRLLRGLRSSFAADRQKSGRMPFIPQDKPALQGNDGTEFVKNRCSRSACSEQRRGRLRLR